GFDVSAALNPQRRPIEASDDGRRQQVLEFTSGMLYLGEGHTKERVVGSRSQRKLTRDGDVGVGVGHPTLSVGSSFELLPELTKRDLLTAGLGAQHHHQTGRAAQMLAGSARRLAPAP